ncbi:MAG: hypothetical protein R3C10_21810 [Pirellulales bacterium]|nr:hypothetical protein [Planctomycetales bacterium]
MNPYSTASDDFYVNMILSTEMELPSNRETVLHYFEQVRKQYPSMRNFYNRDRGDFILEEDKDKGQYRWTSIEPRRVCSGGVNPAAVDEALDQHRFVLELVPYHLACSPLDCEALDLLYGFDFSYRGNQNQLVAEALGVNPALEKMMDHAGVTVINAEPSLTLALDEECRTQIRVSIETRTNAYHVRTGEYPPDQLSVYLTARQYGSLPTDNTFVDALDRLARVVDDFAQSYLVDNVLQPLARTISLK